MDAPGPVQRNRRVQFTNAFGQQAGGLWPAIHIYRILRVSGSSSVRSSPSPVPRGARGEGPGPAGNMVQQKHYASNEGGCFGGMWKLHKTRKFTLMVLKLSCSFILLNKEQLNN